MIVLNVNFAPYSFDYFKYRTAFEQANDPSLNPYPRLISKYLLPLSKTLIERSDVYEELIGGHVAHLILVIPHSVLKLNRTLMYWDNSFLAAQGITFVVLRFGAMPSTLPLTSRAARKKTG